MRFAPFGLTCFAGPRPLRVWPRATREGPKTQAGWSFAGGSWRWHGRPIAIRPLTDERGPRPALAQRRVCTLSRTSHQRGVEFVERSNVDLRLVPRTRNRVAVRAAQHPDRPHAERAGTHEILGRVISNIRGVSRDHAERVERPLKRER